jgi:hypothetical protein
MKSFKHFLQEQRLKRLHSFGTIQVQAPASVAYKITEFSKLIPNEMIYTEPSYGRETDIHVTLRYGHELDSPEVLLPLVSELPCLVHFGLTSFFSAAEYDVLKIDVTSEGLSKMNLIAGTLCTFPGETHKDYKPHCTIAYLKKGFVHKFIDFDLFKTSFEADEIHVINKADERRILRKDP